MEISQSTNSVSVGDVITYTVDIRNESNSSEKSVVLSFVLSEGLEFSRFNSVSAELALRAPREGRYEVERIAEIRPQGLRRFRIEARAETAGKESLHVQVVSLSGPEPRDHTLSTQVVP